MDGDTCCEKQIGEVPLRDIDLVSYIGTKVVLAKPMTNSEWVKGKNQESTGQDGYLVIYDNGYRAWSPKDVFDIHYRPITQSEKQTINY